MNNDSQSKNLFVGLYPTEIYLYSYITKFEIIKNLERCDLLSCERILKKINNRYTKDYKNIYKLPLIDSANTRYLRKELNLINNFKLIYLYFKTNIQIKKIFKNKNYEKVFFSDSSESILTSRIIIHHLRKKKIKICRLGYCDKRYNRKKDIGIVNFLNNNYFPHLPRVKCIVSNKNGILLERQFVEDIYNDKLIYNSNTHINNSSNLLNFNLEKINQKKRKIFFFDRGHGLLSFYNYEKIEYDRLFLNIINCFSKFIYNKYELNFKPHPNQSFDKNLYNNFNIIDQKRSAEDILIEERENIKAVFGISSTTMRFSDLLSIDTYSLRYIFKFDDNEAFDSLFRKNTNIKHIKSLNDLENKLISL